jgi:TPR repeat protein
MTLPFFRYWFSRPVAPALSPALPPTETLDAESQFQLGLHLATAEGENQDYAQAARWYAQAAAQNHTLAQLNLAQLYAQGQGVSRDVVKSLMWMTRAAELGDAGAQYRLGMRRHRSSRDDEPDAAPEARIEALKWVRLSAGKGYRGADQACDLLALGMTIGEVAEGERRAAAFVAGQSPATKAA